MPIESSAIHKIINIYALQPKTSFKLSKEKGFIRAADKEIFSPMSSDAANETNPMINFLTVVGSDVSGHIVKRNSTLVFLDVFNASPTCIDSKREQ